MADRRLQSRDPTLLALEEEIETRQGTEQKMQYQITFFAP